MALRREFPLVGTAPDHPHVWIRELLSFLLRRPVFGGRPGPGTPPGQVAEDQRGQERGRCNLTQNQRGNSVIMRAKTKKIGWFHYNAIRANAL